MLRASVPLALRGYGVVAEALKPLLATIALAKGGTSAWHGVLVRAPPPRPRCDYLLWVHGASVGETMSALPIVRAVLERDHLSAVLITASTETALSRLALERLGPRVVLQLRPVDCTSTMRRFLSHWQPSGLLLIESELWPNLLLQSQRAGVPISLVNARLSERSAKRWSAAEPLRESLGFLLSLCDVTLAQTPQMASRLRMLGAVNKQYVGDLKQLPSSRPPEAIALLELRATLGASGREPDSSACHLSSVSSGCPSGTPRSSAQGGAQTGGTRAARAARAGRCMWLAASTHAGEEATVLEAHAKLRRAHPGLLLLLAPRHLKRAGAIVAAATDRGWLVARRSRGEPVPEAAALYVCDTLGELSALYELVGVAFVGGSLVPLGGHNLLEAARVPSGCTILHGPHTEAVGLSRDILAATCPPAARCVRDAHELAAEVRALLECGRTLHASRKAAARAAAALERGVLDRVWEQLQVPLGLPGHAGRTQKSGSSS